MLKRFLSVLALATVFGPHIAGQTVRVSADCKSPRLGSAERVLCASPELTKLAGDIDQLTGQLETRLSGRSKEVIVDTERPFAGQFANCQNDPSNVGLCVDRVLRHRMSALTAAGASTTPILDELAQYSVLDIRYFQKYGEMLIGKRVSVYGCMTLAPGPTPASRTRGAITESCSGVRGGPSVAAVFTRMDGTRAAGFYDTKHPSSHWEGIVERQAGQVVLAQIDP